MVLLNTDFFPCLCGHDAAFHCKQFTTGEQPGEVVFNTYLHCEWNDYHYGTKQYSKMQDEEDYCKCRKFQQDNLRYLERKSDGQI